MLVNASQGMRYVWALSQVVIRVSELQVYQQKDAGWVIKRCTKFIGLRV